jgi:multimeric flavodoxin WrbA
MTFTILNGSLGGRTGNTNNLIQKIKRIILKRDSETKIKIIHLSPSFDWIKVRRAIKASDALIFCTGTYWDSWGSPMQQLFEKMTQIEGKKHLLGKPAGAIVTMHSVGGKEVCSRILGNLVGLGCMIPPFAGFAYSYADHVAHQKRTTGNKLLDDVWHIKDLEAFIHNLFEARSGTNNWIVWDYLDTEAMDPNYVWLK